MYCWSKTKLVFEAIIIEHFFNPNLYFYVKDTRDFEEKELNQSFVKLMSEFGAKVDRLSVETDIRPEYFHRLFPNIEYLEMFARASRKVCFVEKSSLGGAVFFIQ